MKQDTKVAVLIVVLGALITLTAIKVLALERAWTKSANPSAIALANRQVPSERKLTASPPSPTPSPAVTHKIRPFQMTCVDAEGAMRCESTDAVCYLFPQGVSCLKKGF